MKTAEEIAAELKAEADRLTLLVDKLRHAAALLDGTYVSTRQSAQ